MKKTQRPLQVLSYHPMDEPSELAWLELLNSEPVRKHLLDHPRFTRDSLATWLRAKLAAEQSPGCRIRAIQCGDELAGWCGIQLEAGLHELALVLAPAYWGKGREVMAEIQRWARELGHRQLLAHFPGSRPQTRAIERLFGQPIGTSEIHGHPFNTYRIEILPPVTP